MPGLENLGSETGKLAHRLPIEKFMFSVEFKALGPRDAAGYHVVGPRKCVFHGMNKNVLGIVLFEKIFFDSLERPQVRLMSEIHRKSMQITENH